jgi:multiple antibiotic resistance protein
MLNIDPLIIVPLSIQLFAIMDPLAAIPTLLDVITKVPEGEVNKLINKAALAIFALINVFTMAGWYILSLFGISMPAFKVAAGIILMAIALDTLITGHKPEKLDMGAYIIVPIATPLIVGPGTMTLLLTSAKVYGIINTLISSYIAFTLTYITIRNARRIVKLTGETFIHGLGRFMSIIIASFAIEMMASGINEYMSKQT